ncbi:MAG: 3'-5' exonuclease [Thermoleophilaceae bacterium]|nr:3'-5' exonuclease [Thermoleophilaceae bacterium]
MTSWRAASFVVVDVETTGLDRRRDEVLSFAAVPVRCGRVLAGEAVTGLVRPSARPSPSSVEIHGLRAADLATAPPAPEAFAPLVVALEGRIPVAHAAWMERDFLRPRLRPLGFRMPRRIIDTAVLWRTLCIERGDGDPGWCALAAVAAALELPSHRPHVAAGDALTTAQVFLALATHLERGGGGSVRALATARWSVRAHRLWHPAVRSG